MPLGPPSLGARVAARFVDALLASGAAGLILRLAGGNRVVVPAISPR